MAWYRPVVLPRLLACACLASLASPAPGGGGGGAQATPPGAGAAAGGGPTATEAGFARIFNGKDLAGWTGDTAGYLVEDGAIVCGPKGTNLYTVAEYGDFVLRFSFLLSPGANNGIGVRAPLSGDAAYEGLELQVLDDGHEKYRGWLKDWQRHGSVYGIAASKGSTAALRPAGQWNEQEIAVDGRKVRVTLNGTVILDVDLDEAARAGTLSGKEHPGLRRTAGHVGFLGHGDRVAYRDIRIRPLGAASTR